MTIVVNGKETTLNEGATVRELIERLGLGGQPCACEVNRELVPHRAHAATALREGDRVELVSLVGGG